MSTIAGSSGVSDVVVAGGRRRSRGGVGRAHVDDPRAGKALENLAHHRMVGDAVQALGLPRRGLFA
jgi:hypothetical protein